MHRLVVLFLTLVALVGSPFAIRAQEATPGAMGPSMLSQAGLPELRVSVSSSAIQAPTEIAAGQVLVVVDSTIEFPAALLFFQIPEGMTIDEVLPMLLPPPEEEAPASPEAEAAASPVDGGEEIGAPPPLFYEVRWGGGVFTTPGFPSEVVLTLTPGEWWIISDGGAAPVALNVTGEMPADAGVQADVEVEFKDFQFIFPEQVAAGQQVWKVNNTGDQPHEMFIVKTPRRLTLEEAKILLELPEDELPPAGVPNPAEFVDIGGSAPISKDQTTYFEVNLEPGAYVAVCFMPDKDNGMPHALKGMVVIFEVPEEGITVEPPASPVPEEEHEMGTPTS